MNDYIVLVDENGQPYIAHANIMTNLRKGAKSVAKLVDGAKTRYFATQKELQAYYNKSKTSKIVNKAKQVARDKIGITARDDLRSAKNKLAKDKTRAERDELRAEKLMRKDVAEYDSNGRPWYKTENAARVAADSELKAIRSANEVIFQEQSVEYFAKRFAETPLGKIEANISKIKNFRNTVSKTIEKYRDRIVNALKNEPPRPKLSPEGTENIIQETIIPETIISETIIPETIIPETFVKDKKRK